MGDAVIYMSSERGRLETGRLYKECRWVILTNATVQGLFFKIYGRNYYFHGLARDEETAPGVVE